MGFCPFRACCCGLLTQHKGEFHLIKYNIDMKQIDIKQINDNVFETIGKEWILVAAGNKDKFNMMTASWGCLGWLWNKPVAVVHSSRALHTRAHRGQRHHDSLFPGA